MAGLDRLQRAMEHLGPIDDDIVSIVQIDDAAWVVRYDGFDVELGFDRAGSTASLQVDVGPASAAGREDLYASMMQYNLLQRDTGGIVLAAKADHTVVQMLDLGGADLDEHALGGVLADFVGKARAWRSLLATARLGDAEPGLEFSEEMFTVRV